MAGVDQFQAAASQVDAPEQGRDELVGGGVRGDVPAGLLGLIREPGAAPEWEQPTHVCGLTRPGHTA